MTLFQRSFMSRKTQPLVIIRKESFLTFSGSRCRNLQNLSGVSYSSKFRRIGSIRCRALPHSNMPRRRKPSRHPFLHELEKASVAALYIQNSISSGFALHALIALFFFGNNEKGGPNRPVIRSQDVTAISFSKRQIGTVACYHRTLKSLHNKSFYWLHVWCVSKHVRPLSQIFPGSIITKDNHVAPLGRI